MIKRDRREKNQGTREGPAQGGMGCSKKVYPDKRQVTRTLTRKKGIKARKESLGEKRASGLR